MSTVLLYILLGLAGGALSAAFGVSMVLLHRGAGVINFAQAGIAMWAVYVYDSAHRVGRIPLPSVGLPSVNLGGPVNTVIAAAIGILSAMLVGLLAHLLVFRWMRHAPPLAKIVGTVGVLLALQGLVAHKFGTGVLAISPLYDAGTIHLGGAAVGVDRLTTAALVIAAALLVSGYFRLTRLGAASCAAAENEIGALLIGLRPQRLAMASWLISSAVAGAFAILAAPVTGVSPSIYPLLVVGGLAAALVARFTSPLIAGIVGIALGAGQSLLVWVQTETWVPSWARTGLPETLPLVVIVVAMWVMGASIPGRANAAADRLPAAPAPAHPLRTASALAAAGAVGIFALHGQYRLALLISLLAFIIMASLVVLTGLLGQVSLAQITIAGIAGFSLSKLSDGAGLGFPVSPIFAISLAIAASIVVGLPALRIRGPQLAVVTLALALTAEKLVFDNPAMLNSQQIAPVPAPHLGGWNLGPLGSDFPSVTFSLLVLAATVISALMVMNLCRSRTGMNFLAVRSSERAAAAAGIDLTRTKLSGFAIAGALAGTAGVLLSYLRGQITGDGFDVFIGLSALAIAYVGGITTVGGALIGSLAFSGGLFYVTLNSHVDLGTYYLLLTGVVLAASAVLNPDGAAQKLRVVVAAVASRGTGRSRPQETRPNRHPATIPDVPVA